MACLRRDFLFQKVTFSKFLHLRIACKIKRENKSQKSTKMKSKFFLLLLLLHSFVLKAQKLAPASVLVSDFDGNPIAGAQIQFINTKSSTILESVSDANGKFDIQLAAGLYNIRLKHVGKTKDYSQIEIPTLGHREVYNNVNIIIQYEEEKSFTLSDLHFDTGRSTIKPESFSVLDELVKFLELKPNLNIEVGGHTDSDGSDAENLILSLARAEAVKTYLIKKGIQKSRLTAKGYGETKPIADNNTARGKALNRRTEITVLE